MTKRFIIGWLTCCWMMGMGGAAGAADKPWVVLTGCQYVVHPGNDGDSFRFQWKGGEYTARLYYVDAPESNLDFPERVREQSEHFGITLDETWRMGVQAGVRAREFMKEPFVIRTRWAAAPGRGRSTRFYVLVESGEKSLIEDLVCRGLAYPRGVSVKLPTGESAAVIRKKLEALEREAQENGRGAWANSKKKEAPVE